MKKITELVLKYKDLILYGIFGVFTTVVNLLVFWLCGKVLGEDMYLVSNGIAWFAAVVFAYFTNKLFVFESKSWKPAVLAKEIPSFAGARVLTLGIEELGLLVMIKWLHLDVPLTIGPVGGEFIIKAILAVIVVLLNYIFSKLLIFKKK